MELYGLGKDRYRFVHHLEAFAKLVAAKEREECEKICQDLYAEDETVSVGECVDAIRARGDKHDLPSHSLRDDVAGLV